MSRKDELLALAERVEAADARQQYSLLVEAFCALHDGERPDMSSATHGLRFARMLLAEAYESAAMSLVPEGWSYEARQGPSGFPHLWELLTIASGDVRYTRVHGRGRSAALALTAAALRALAATEQ